MTIEAPIAMDRASVRSYDEDGHLRISLAAISKANICPYLGREVPDYERLGLNADRVYQLLRHPDELAKAASTWEGKPLLSVHVPQSAQDHRHEITIGAVGHPVEFQAPYLVAPLTVWDKAYIDRIESGEQKELSSAYRYDADMTPGTYNGVAYHGVMRNLRANHVAVVEQGRAGPDVVIGDAKPEGIPLTVTVSPADAESIAADLQTAMRKPPPIPAPEPVPTPDPTPEPQPTPPAAIVQDAKPPKHVEITLMAKRQAATQMSRRALVAGGALHAYLLPKMATDTKIDLGDALKGVTAKNWTASKPKIKAALDKALAGKLAQDADLSDVIELLDRLDDVTDEMEDIEAAPIAEAVSDPDPAPAEDDDDDAAKRLREILEAANVPSDVIDQAIAALHPEVDPSPAAADPDPAPAQDADKEDDKDDDKKKNPFAKDKDPVAEPTVTKAAMDRAIAAAVKLAADSAARSAEKSTIARLRAISDAEKAVRPYVGELAIAQDSAAAVYRLALDAAGVDLTGVPEAAFPAMLKLLPKPGEQIQQTAKPARIAADSAALTARAQMFPNANRLSAI